MKTTGQLLGEQLMRLRDRAHLSVADLAKKLHKSRAWIYDVEAGAKNFTVDEYDKLLEGCEASAETIFSDPKTSDIPRDLFWMLESIVNSGDKDLLFGLRVTLGAMSREARAAPRPILGENEQRKERSASTPTADLKRTKKKAG